MEIKVFGFKARVEVIIVSMIIGCLLCCHLICGCATREGMASMATLVRSLPSKDGLQEAEEAREGMAVAGSTIGYKMDQGVHTDKYEQTVGLQEVNGGSRLSPTVPLPEGQLFMWANNEFSGKCCANSNVSGGNGCACVTKEQGDYLNSRGGNRANGSEF